MLKVYLTFTLLSLFIFAKAVDTLTVRQVYNYNVGDTLDFEISNNGIIDDGTYQQLSFERRIVSSKRFNTIGDTLFISFNHDSIPDLIINNLDSVAIFYASNYIVNHDTMQCTYEHFSFDTTSYPGIVSNSFNAGCFEVGFGYKFSRGLGRTYYANGGGDPIGDQSYYSETLVYYSNGITRVGSPLEDLNGNKNIYYVPLPEECATWTRTVLFDGPPGMAGDSIMMFTEQIQTGAKYPHNGFNYVEMLYNDGYSPDTLIGYFYNDSVNRMAFYVSAIDSPVQVLCDFTGSGKTSFCRWLCPPVLADYIAENINTDKDSQIALATNFLINMDELATLSKIEINALKSLISKDKINLRLPFDRRATVRPRRASFVGSTNKDEFLTDETGSLRWLCFELTAKLNFDYKQDINIDNIWRQAYTLYVEGYPYQLTQEEVDENEKANKQFTVNTPEMELIQKMFRPGTKEKHDFFFTATDILKEISKGDNMFINCKSYAIGRAMKFLGFQRAQHYNENLKQSIYGYYLFKI